MAESRLRRHIYMFGSRDHRDVTDGAASGISVGAVVAFPSTHESCRGAGKPWKRSELYKNMKLNDVQA